MPETKPSDILDLIREQVADGVRSLYGGDVRPEALNLSPTRREFEGDYTLVTFPLARLARKKPDAIARDLGENLVANLDAVEAYHVIKGFLNLTVSDRYWVGLLDRIEASERYGHHPASGNKVVVEFSSPNTNKPLHLGHIRNILLGWSSSRLLEAAGHEVVKVQVVNDRGIAICKSMLAWERFGDDATPEGAGVKGDHFVGRFYVQFERAFQEEYRAWQTTEAADAQYERRPRREQSRDDFFRGFRNTYFNEHSVLGAEAKDMLRRWEAGDPATVDLWKTMNGWVYDGFDTTYRALGVAFDKLYYESETYLLGKDLIDRGLADGVFYRREDGSVWADLTDAGLDEKLVLRSDGTSVYITQDLGTAQQRYRDFGADRMVYVVADEQNYHFQVLFELLRRLREPYADGLYHLAYGMVDLPSGRMKSREGTVVDADDLVAEVIDEARVNTEEGGELAMLPEDEQQRIIRQIGLAALKFHIIKVQPRKRMVFDPKESVDLQGQTGPYVQYAYVRTQAILRKAAEGESPEAPPYEPLKTAERDLLKLLHAFPEEVRTAAEEYDPSSIAQYCYGLAKEFHRFYYHHSILGAESESARQFRLRLVRAIGQVLKSGMDLLGIEMPERM